MPWELGWLIGFVVGMCAMFLLARWHIERCVRDKRLVINGNAYLLQRDYTMEAYRRRRDAGMSVKTKVEWADE